MPQLKGTGAYKWTLSSSQHLISVRLSQKHCMLCRLAHRPFKYIGAKVTAFTHLGCVLWYHTRCTTSL